MMALRRWLGPDWLSSTNSHIGPSKRILWVGSKAVWSVTIVRPLFDCEDRNVETLGRKSDRPSPGATYNAPYFPPPPCGPTKVMAVEEAFANAPVDTSVNVAVTVS